MKNRPHKDTLTMTGLASQPELYKNGRGSFILDIVTRTPGHHKSSETAELMLTKDNCINTGQALGSRPWEGQSKGPVPTGDGG